MTKKQKQKKLKKGDKIEASIQAKEKNITPSQAPQKKEVVLTLEKKKTQDVVKPIPKKKHWFHTNLWTILAIVFSLGVLFVLMLAWAYQFDIAGVRSFINKTVTLTNTNNSTEATEEISTDDGKVTALNGLKFDAHEMFHPYAVMFDNHSEARPQSHLQSASLVYETLVEGSITRFMAIFDHGNEDKIGPIRSARPYFVQWVDAYDAAYAHAGGSPEALQKIGQYEIKNVIQGQFYWRDYNRASPHNLFTSSELLGRAVRDNNWTASTTITQWKFNDDPEKGTHDDGGAVDLHFSGSSIGSLVRWEYTPETKTYKRFQAGVAHEDASTSAQLTAKTIIVQVIPPIVSIGDHGRLTLNILGTGRADILFEGKRIQGTWKQEVTTDRAKFYDDAGEEITFPRGNMFIEVIPSDREVIFQ